MKRLNGPCDVDPNSVPAILGEDRTQFERVVEHENVNHQLSDEDTTATEGNTVDPDSVDTWMDQLRSSKMLPHRLLL